MEKEKYIAYVGTYTHGSSIGIHLYDVDVEEGTLSERKVVPVNNSSYVVKSKNGKYLYSIADEGVAVFEIKPDGDLELINKVGIDGMRGCYLWTIQENICLLPDIMMARSQQYIHTRMAVWVRFLTACSTKESEVLQNVTSVHMSAV